MSTTYAIWELDVFIGDRGWAVRDTIHIHDIEVADDSLPDIFDALQNAGYLTQYDFHDIEFNEKEGCIHVNSRHSDRPLLDLVTFNKPSGSQE